MVLRNLKTIQQPESKDRKVTPKNVDTNSLYNRTSKDNNNTGMDQNHSPMMTVPFIQYVLREDKLKDLSKFFLTTIKKF